MKCYLLNKFKYFNRILACCSYIKFFYTTIVLVVMLLNSIAFAATFQAQDATASLIHYLNGIQSYSAHFKQTLKDEQGQILNEAEGQASILKPGRFKWVLYQPTQQTIIADGSKLWVYDVDLEQVSIFEQSKQLQQTPVLLLLSDEPEVFLKHYLVSSKQGEPIRFSLYAKDKDADLVAMHLIFSNGQIKQLLLVDQMGQHTTLDFERAQPHAKLSANLFKFKPPSGVDVIDNR